MESTGAEIRGGVAGPVTTVDEGVDAVDLSGLSSNLRKMRTVSTNTNAQIRIAGHVIPLARTGCSLSPAS